MRYDVIIVGAGPAGSACAKILSQNGIKPLLIDRYTFPRVKVCGDGLTPGTTRLLKELDVFSYLEKKPINFIKAIRFVTPWLQKLDIPFKSKHKEAGFLIVKRTFLDQALLQSALDSGAIFLQAEVLKVVVEKNRVTGVIIRQNKRQSFLKAKLIIGADGASSVVARSLGISKAGAEQRFLAIRGYITGLKTFDQMVEFIWTAKLKPGYFWIFPISDHQANIGLGLPADLFQKSNLNLRTHFFEILRGPLLKDRLSPNFKITELRSWPIPLAGSPKRARVFNGALLIGDAGYWVDPLSGEGIHNALRTGIIAAQVAQQALQKGDFSATFLKQYEQMAWQELGPTIKRSRTFVWAMRHLPYLMESYFFLARHNRGVFKRFFSNLSQDFEFL